MKSVLFLFLGLLFSLTVQSQNCQIIDSAIVTDVRCHLGTDGSIDLVLLNPLGLYAYAWNTTEIIQDITNLPPGTYSVTVTDLTDTTCTQDTSYTVTQPQDPLSTVVNLVSDVKCYGDSSGSATAENAIGGTFPYTYAWDNGQTSPIAVNLWAATHTVTVTDANGCTFQSSIDIVNSNPAITGVANILNHVSCFGACDADIEFSSAGGILPHTYNWSPVSISNYNGSGPDTAFNVCVGGHNVLIEDLAELDTVHQYIQGHLNAVPDAASRYPLLGPKRISPRGLSHSLTQLLSKIPSKFKMAKTIHVHAGSNSADVRKQVQAWASNKGSVQQHAPPRQG
jgi:hypothetical protein